MALGQKNVKKPKESAIFECKESKLVVFAIYTVTFQHEIKKIGQG
jgi:hypothetical protein